MNPMPLSRHRRASWRLGLAGALLCMGAGFLAFCHPEAGEFLELLSYDLPFKFARPEVCPEAYVIQMDRDSAHVLSQPEDGNIWNRTNHTALLRQPCVQKARLVVFDVTFLASSAKAAVDEEFAQAIRDHQHVLLASAGSADGPSRTNRGGLPVGPLASAAPSASAELPTNSDGRIRQHPAGGGLAWTAAKTIQEDLPPPTANRWINYNVTCRSLPYIHFLNTNAFRPDFFSNRVLFVGGWGSFTPHSLTKEIDAHGTSFTRWDGQTKPGVEIQAIAFLNLVHGDWLKRIPGSVELLLVLAVGLLFGAGLSVLPPWPAAWVALTGLTALPGLDLYLVAHQHLWFPWAVPALVQIPCALGWAVLGGTLRRVRETPPAATDLGAGTATTPRPAAAPPTQPGSTPAPRGGMLIADHALLTRVGEGAYGEVWLARNLVGLYHAVKIVRRQKFEDRTPFDREFRGIEKYMPVSFNHPGLVRVLHVGRDEAEDYFFYIMEVADDQVSGQHLDPATYAPRNLSGEIRRRTRLPLAECVQLGLNLCDALAYLHGQQLIHRDLKPSNIIFVNGRPKLADIGLVTDIVGVRTHVTWLGTLGFIAPEGPGEAAADLFSLGKILYEAWTGLKCHQFPEMPPEWLETIHDPAMIQMNRILLKACESDPTRRYSVARELHADLQALNQRLAQAEP